MKYRTIISLITFLVTLLTCNGFAMDIGIKTATFATEDTTSNTIPEWYTDTDAILGQTVLSRGHGYGKSEALGAALTALATRINSYVTTSQSTDKNNEPSSVFKSETNIKIGNIVISDSSSVTTKQHESERLSKTKLSFSKDSSEAEVKYIWISSDSSVKSLSVTNFSKCSWSDIEEDLAQINIYVLAKQTADGCFVGLMMKQDLVESFFNVIVITTGF